MKLKIKNPIVLLLSVAFLASCAGLKEKPSYELNVYWIPKNVMTLYPYGVEEIKTSYYQKIDQRYYQLKQDHLMELKKRIDSLPDEKSKPEIEPKKANLRLLCEFRIGDELLFEVSTGQSTNLVVINNQVWEDDPEFYEKHILEVIERK